MRVGGTSTTSRDADAKRRGRHDKTARPRETRERQSLGERRGSVSEKAPLQDGLSKRDAIRRASIDLGDGGDMLLAKSK
jgi:hypothetical protein